MNKKTINNRNEIEQFFQTEILITSGPTSIIYESIVYGCKLFYLFLDPDLILKKLSFPKKNFFVCFKQRNFQIFKYWNKRNI